MSTTQADTSTAATEVPQSTAATEVPQSTAATEVPQSTAATEVPQSTEVPAEIFLAPTPATTAKAAKQRARQSFATDVAQLTSSIEYANQCIETLCADAHFEAAATACLAEFKAIDAYRPTAFIASDLFNAMRTSAASLVQHATRIHAALLADFLADELAERCAYTGRLINAIATQSSHAASLIYKFPATLQHTPVAAEDPTKLAQAAQAYKNYCAAQRQRRYTRRATFKRGEIVGAKDHLGRWWMARIEACLVSRESLPVYYVEFIGFPAQHWEFMTDTSRIAKYNPARHPQFRSVATAGDVIDIDQYNMEDNDTEDVAMMPDINPATLSF